MRASGEVQYIMYVAGPFAALQALGAVLPETELLDSHPDQAASRVVEPFQRSHSVLNSYLPPSIPPLSSHRPLPCPQPLPWSPVVVSTVHAFSHSSQSSCIGQGTCLQYCAHQAVINEASC